MSVLVESADTVPDVPEELDIFLDLNPGMDRTGMSMDAAEAGEVRVSLSLSLSLSLLLSMCEWAKVCVCVCVCVCVRVWVGEMGRSCESEGASKDEGEE